jgi:hypothetical protein
MSARLEASSTKFLLSEAKWYFAPRQFTSEFASLIYLYKAPRGPALLLTSSLGIFCTIQHTIPAEADERETYRRIRGITSKVIL